MGISPCEPDRKSVEYLKQYQDTSTEYDNGRYHAKLPCKQDHPALPTNHNITLKRTVGTKQRLRIRWCGGLMVTHWSTIQEVPGLIPGRGTGHFRNASSVSHPTRDVLV
ncbi:hypothetical protein DPMN_054294 [Dreissena polymorpha]|uniref:Uncharacterized protein n=1 Tax=Dreissena polymorpha TaxID=45954 RepID=A0A9D4CMW2_DREPO|nr:hypothetical protein DPMN_054294 [Dreissena polymorpha]